MNARHDRVKWSKLTGSRFSRLPFFLSLPRRISNNATEIGGPEVGPLFSRRITEAPLLHLEFCHIAYILLASFRLHIYSNVFKEFWHTTWLSQCGDHENKQQRPPT